MSSLASFSEVVGFFSYSRDDDEDFGRQLSSLRDAIEKELAAALGRRANRDFRLWQDQYSIAPGELWEQKITEAIGEATFFIPIITPRAVGSEHCRFEFSAFVGREQELGRNNLIFPIHYITVPALADDSTWRQDPILSIVGARQFVDWRKLRQWPTETPTYREAIIDFCERIANALRQPWASTQERQQREVEAGLLDEAALRERIEPSVPQPDTDHGAPAIQSTEEQQRLSQAVDLPSEPQARTIWGGPVVKAVRIGALVALVGFIFALSSIFIERRVEENAQRIAENAKMASAAARADHDAELSAARQRVSSDAAARAALQTGKLSYCTAAFAAKVANGDLDPESNEAGFVKWRLQNQ